MGKALLVQKESKRPICFFQDMLEASRIFSCACDVLARLTSGQELGLFVCQICVLKAVNLLLFRNRASTSEGPRDRTLSLNAFARKVLTNQLASV